MNSVKLSCETLDHRDMPSITWAGLPGYVLEITSDHESDIIRIRNHGNGVSVNGSVFANVAKVIVNGNGGNDTIDCNGLRRPCIINGGSGNDLLIGGAASDVIHGNGGHDVIFGGAGHDVLDGGSGDDRIFGGAGFDSIYGGSGNDYMDDSNRTRHEYYDGGEGMDFIADAWTVQGCQVSDIVQGQSGTCQFLAGLAAGVDAGINYGRKIVYRGYDATGTGHYDVTIWNPYARRALTTRVLFAGDSNYRDALTAAEAPDRVAEYEYWPLLMQRAYTTRINSTNFAIGYAAATYGRGTYLSPSHDKLRTTLLWALNNNRPVTTAIDHARLYGITDHALAIVAWSGSSSNPTLTVYNPWGRDGRTSNNETYAIQGANDGYFQVSWSTFLTYFDGGIYVR